MSFVLNNPSQNDTSLSDIIELTIKVTNRFDYLLTRNNIEALFFPDRKGLNFKKIIKILESAQEKIDLCMYFFTNDEIASLLTQKAIEGVKIRIIYDS